MKDEIKRLWELLPHPTMFNPTVRWFAKGGNIKWGGHADSAAELLNAARNCPDMNFYVAPNPVSSRTGVRHNAKDVTHWSWFLLDVDPVVKEDYNPHLAMGDALMWLDEWLGRKLSPVVIDSGRGMQAWIRLEDILFDDLDPCTSINGIYYYNGQPISMRRRIARLTMRHWLDKLDKKIGEVGGCRIDTTCSDLPRVMRCPGTMNVKTGRRASILSGQQFIHGGLATLLVTGVPPEKFRVDPVPSLPAGSEWQDVFVHLTVKAQSYLTRGKVDPGRHETMWHTARNLAERGLTRDATRRALQWANSRQGPDKELTIADIDHALDTAFSCLTLPGAGSTIDGETPTQEEAC